MICICEVLLSIGGAGHIRHLCKMHFGRSAIPYDFQPIRCENEHSWFIFVHIHFY